MNLGWAAYSGTAVVGQEGRSPAARRAAQYASAEPVVAAEYWGNAGSSTTLSTSSASIRAAASSGNGALYRMAGYVRNCAPTAAP